MLWEQLAPKHHSVAGEQPTWLGNGSQCTAVPLGPWAGPTGMEGVTLPDLVSGLKRPALGGVAWQSQWCHSRRQDCV